MSTAVTIWPRRLISPSITVRRQRHRRHLLVAEHFLDLQHIDAEEQAVDEERGEFAARVGGFRASVVGRHDLAFLSGGHRGMSFDRARQLSQRQQHGVAVEFGLVIRKAVGMRAAGLSLLGVIGQGQRRHARQARRALHLFDQTMAVVRRQIESRQYDIYFVALELPQSGLGVGGLHHAITRHFERIAHQAAHEGGSFRDHHRDAVGALRIVALEPALVGPLDHCVQIEQVSHLFADDRRPQQAGAGGRLAGRNLILHDVKYAVHQDANAALSIIENHHLGRILQAGGAVLAGFENRLERGELQNPSAVLHDQFAAGVLDFGERDFFQASD